MGETFTITLRGYDRYEVDRLLDRAETALASDDRGLRQSALSQLRSATFAQRLRGYDRNQVQRLVDELIDELGR